MDVQYSNTLAAFRIVRGRRSRAKPFAIIFATWSPETRMILTSTSFGTNARIPADFAFCAPDPKTHATLSNNRNPQLAWRDAPAETRSYALICHDPDVPSKPDDVNQEGRFVPATLPRVDFFHWLLVDV